MWNSGYKRERKLPRARADHLQFNFYVIHLRVFIQWKTTMAVMVVVVVLVHAMRLYTVLYHKYTSCADVIYGVCAYSIVLDAERCRLRCSGIKLQQYYV